MPRSTQLSQRMLARRQVAAKRGLQKQKRLPTVLPRSKFAHQQVLQKRENEATKKAVGEYVDSIEAGKITNLSQIPEKYRKFIKITQSDLDKISGYYSAKRYEAAYNQVMKHYQKGMLWAVAGFGSGLQQQIARKLIKQGYAPSKLAMEREAKERTDALRNLFGTVSTKNGLVGTFIDYSGSKAKALGVTMRGNTFFDTKTNKPISLSKIMKKKAIQEVESNLPIGDKLIYDRNTYNIKGIDSGLLKQSIPYTDKALVSYSKRLSNLGGLSKGATGKVTNITPSSKPGRVDIRLRNGKVIDINAEGGVVLSKSITGYKSNLYFYNGQWVEKLPPRGSSNVTLKKVGIDTKKLKEAVTAGDKKFVAFKKGVEKRLIKLGVPTAKIKQLDNKYWAGVNRELSKIGLGKRDLSNYRKEILKYRDRKDKELRNLTADQRKLLAEVSARIRQDKSLSDSEIRKRIKAEMSKDSFKRINTAIHNSGHVIAIGIIDSLINIGVATPLLIKQVGAAPLATVVALPPAIVDGLKSDIKTVKSGDLLKIAELAAEYYTIGKVFNVAGATGRTATRGVRKLLPGYVKQVNGKYIIRKAPKEIFKVKGTTRYLKTRVQKPSIKRPVSSIADKLKGRKPGQFKKFTKDPGLVLKKQTVESGSMPFAEQLARFSGKKFTGVNASYNQLTSLIRRKATVRKPFNLTSSKLQKRFPKGEASFPTRIKKLLKEFDSGKKLKINEIVELNTWLGKNVEKNITILERSLYVDIDKGLRLSRLGIQAEADATLRDIVKLNFKWFGAKHKPQVLIFENAQMAKAPKYIQTIARKFNKTGKISNIDLAKYTNWQTTKGSGLFRASGNPIYKGGIELEATLAPGEMIRRIKQVGVKYIDGKKVTFVTAKVYKPTKSILKQMKMAELGKLNKVSLSKLEKVLSKKLGRKVKVATPETAKRYIKISKSAARRADTSIPVIRIHRNGIKVMAVRLKPSVKRKITKRKVAKKKPVTRKRPSKRPKAKRKTPKRKPTPRKKAKRPTAKRKPVKRKPTPRKPSKRPKAKRVPVKRAAPKRKPTPRAGRPSKTTKKKKPAIRPAQGFRPKTLSKKVQTYYVVEKVRGKFKKLYPKPLTAKGARDFAVYSIDNHLSKTAFFVPLGKAKKVVQAPKKIQGYYSKNKVKVRPYKIRYGKKKLMVNGYIEKRKYFQDTKQERLQAAKLRAKKRKPVKRKIVKKKPVARKKKVVKKRKTTPRKRAKRKVVKRKTTRRVTKRKKK